MSDKSCLINHCFTCYRGNSSTQCGRYMRKLRSLDNVPRELRSSNAAAEHWNTSQVAFILAGFLICRGLAPVCRPRALARPAQCRRNSWPQVRREQSFPSSISYVVCTVFMQSFLAAALTACPHCCQELVHRVCAAAAGMLCSTRDGLHMLT